jgi:integrase
MSVYKRGDRWHYRFQLGGRQYSGSAGAGAGKAEAIELEARSRTDARSAASQAGPRSRSVDEAIARWLEEYAGRLKGAASLESKVRSVLAHSKDTPLAEIVEVAHRIRTAGLAAGLSAATINRRIAIVRRVANLAHEWGWINDPVGKRIKLLSGERARHVYLNMPEVERLAGACSNPLCALAIRLAARTGLREQEVLRASTIRDGCIEVAAEDAKSGRPRLVPVPPDLPDLSLPLGITYNQLRHDFERARVAAGLPDVRFHDLRHTAASWWLSAGNSLATVRDLLGHANVTVTSRYLHLMPGELKRGAEAVAAMHARTKSAQDPPSD